GYEPEAVVEAVASSDLTKLRQPEKVSIDGMTAEAVLLMLRALRKTGGPVILTATTAKPNDQVVVDGHAYGGRREGSGWQFDAKSLDMACRVAGWSKVERDGNTWRLS